MHSIREISGSCQELRTLPAPTTAQPAQRALPTGPGSIVRGRKRTDEDREWYAQQLRVEHTRLTDKSVYERMAYYASCNPKRDAYPGVARLAREALCSPRTVQYARRRLEAAGLIKSLALNKGGRSTATVTAAAHYRVLGRTSCAPSRAPLAPKVLKNKEGIKEQTKKRTFLSDGVQTLDPGEPERPKTKEVLPAALFPSEEKKQEKAPVPKEQDPAPSREPPVFTHSKQVALLFALQRKLDYRADDGQARVFDDLEHGDKKRILDKLLAEEQQAAIRGLVAAPPPKPRAPRFAGAPVSTAPIRDESYHCVTAHRWTQPASDGVQNCTLCNAEQISVGA